MVSSFLYLSPFIDGGRSQGHSSPHLLFNLRIHAPLTKPRIVFVSSSKSLRRSGAYISGIYIGSLKCMNQLKTISLKSVKIIIENEL